MTQQIDSSMNIDQVQKHKPTKQNQVAAQQQQPQPAFDYNDKINQILFRQENFGLLQQGYDHLDTAEKVELSLKYRTFLTTHIIKDNMKPFRGQLWKVCSGAQSYLEAETRWGDYYTAQLQEQLPLYPNPCFHQIEIDLPRGTLGGGHSLMLKPDLLNEVRRILFAYTQRNPVIGYVQGMNFILGRLILHLNEVEAFWVFTMLLERVLPVDYYAHLMGVHADCHYLEEELLRKVIPEVYEKFRSLSFKSTIFSFNWFCCLFQDKLSDRVSHINVSRVQSYHLRFWICCSYTEAIFCQMQHLQQYINQNPRFQNLLLSKHLSP